jgi:tetratricopeptide (TPR) repeat protein
MNTLIDLAEEARGAARHQDWDGACRAWLAVLEDEPDSVAAHVGAATAFRELGKYAEAGALLDAVPIRAQNDEAVAVARAWLANARRDWALAQRAWSAVRVAFPRNAVAYAGGAAALREDGQAGAAEQLLAEGLARFPDAECLVLARAWQANARADWPDALERWRDAAKRFPANAAVLRGGTRARLAAARGAEADRAAALLEEAEAVLAAARRDGVADAICGPLELEVARARPDWGSVRRIVTGMIARADGKAAALHLDLAQACWNLGDADAADRAAALALEADPGLSAAMVVRAWVATSRGDGDAALACYRRLVEMNPGVVRWSLKVVQLLNWFGHVDEAVAEIEALHRRYPDDPIVRTFLRTYGPAAELATAPDAEFAALRAKAPPEAERRRAVLRTDAQDDVQVGAVPGAADGVLLFAGSNDALSMPLPLFDLFLAALPVTAIYLKDFNRLRFMRGIRSLAGDYAGTLTVLRGMLEDFGIRRLSVIGNCDGGFAAIRYGVELGARRILTFGAPTHSPDDGAAQLEMGRMFMRNRLTREVTAEMTDLRPFLISQARPTPIQLFYYGDDPRDGLHAAHLADVPGVSLHAWPGVDDHALLRRIAASEVDFSATLKRWLLGDEGAS